MSLAGTSGLQAKNWKAVATGLVWGLVAASAWAGYNVGSRLGRLDGLAATDMSMLRFGVAALLLAPFVLSRRNGRPLGWLRLLSLTALAGPLFALLINTAFGLAPLSHAVVLTAGGTMVSATALAWGLDRKRPPAFRIVGMAILLAGLTVIASDQQTHDAQTSEHLWLGDLCFAVAGSLWGVFTYLLGRWKVDPVAGIGHVSILSALIFLPFFLTWHSSGAMASGIWLSQAFFQGILGGCLAPIAFAKAVSRIGASEAALFPALVPSGALLLGIPLLGEWPSASEIAGVAICTAGLLTAFNIMRFFVKPRPRP